MDDASRSSPISFAGGLAGGDEGFTAADQGSQIGSAAGSLQGEGILSGGGEGGSSCDADFGFQRPEVGKEDLVGTVQFYERHLFLCYKTPHVWPSHVEAAEFDRLPRLLSAALAARKGEMKKRTRLTICEGEDGTESSNGDVLIFPDMIRYRRLTHFDVEYFVEEVLVKNSQWLHGAVETLTGSFVFVCSHGSRDRRCGVCGPVLIRKFKEEINSRGLHSQVSVSPCSHIGGHKYAGNVIVFSSSTNGEVTGHWGQMGLREEDQRKAQDLRLQMNVETQEFNPNLPNQETGTDITNGIATEAASCCQGIAASNCCQNGSFNEKPDNHSVNLEEQKTPKLLPEQRNKDRKPSCSTRKMSTLPTWFESWEREDTYAALAVATAIASVAVAYTCYQHLR
ncbi:hypothetical protein KFK09_014585 [Dendrobium nobile]|uniref:Sucrase n=1 Tax=Dendrobium nobile TaxID=94219 RepID=A0A8T3B2K9_DENNO|nr:hypothetical protein KFK09_014585 [Dendrobium nobile]